MRGQSPPSLQKAVSENGGYHGRMSDKRRKQRFLKVKITLPQLRGSLDSKFTVNDTKAFRLHSGSRGHFDYVMGRTRNDHPNRKYPSPNPFGDTGGGEIWLCGNIPVRNKHDNFTWLTSNRGVEYLASISYCNRR